MLNIFGVKWVVTKSVKELLNSWNNRVITRKKGNAWQVIPHCIICTLWQARNKTTFENAMVDVDDNIIIPWKWVEKEWGIIANSFLSFNEWLGE